jgi:hypothetical protein
VSAIKTNRLLMFGKTVAVYCENHTEHTDTVRTSQERCYVSATENNRLMLFRVRGTIYCDKYTENANTPLVQSAEFFRVKAGGTYSDYRALNG